MENGLDKRYLQSLWLERVEAEAGARTAALRQYRKQERH